MPTLFDVMKRVADAKISHQDFSTEMSLYMGEVKTLESVLEYVEGEMVEEFGCESFEKYLEEYEDCASPIDPATLNEKKIELAESVINAQQPQLSMLGIETAWRKNSQLHHGDPEFIVSMTDPINPYNDAGPVTSGLSDLSINQILESKSEPKLAPDVVANLAALEIKDIEPEDQNIEEKRVGIIVK